MYASDIMQQEDMAFTPGLKPLHALEEEEEDEAEEGGFDTIKKQLFSDTEPADLEPSSSSANGVLTLPSQKQSVLMYLRVRPKRQEEIMRHDSDCLHITSEQELTAIPPRNSKTYKNSRSSIQFSQRFTFSKIFDPLTTQKELFDATLRPLLKDFFEGQNCLVFTYGVTNSGR